MLKRPKLPNGFQARVFCFLFFLPICGLFFSPLNIVSFDEPKIFFFFAALGLRCCMHAFSICGERGLLFIVVHRLLIAVASLVGEHGL